MVLMVVDQFLFCHSMFLITGFAMLSAISLYIFYKFGTIVLILIDKQKLIKL